jgi:hypothetical protein
MKQKLLKSTILLFLFGIIIVSCQLEEDVIQEHNHSVNVSFNKMMYKELIKAKRFKEAMRQIPKKKVAIKNTFGKTVMEEQYGFTIYDVPINIMETDSLFSYNLLIKTDSLLHDSFFENLVINTNKITNQTTAYIIKYNLLTPITPTIHNSVYFTFQPSITPIVYDDTQVFSKLNTICYETTAALCYDTVDGGDYAYPHIPVPGACSGSNIQFFTTTTCVTFESGGGNSEGTPDPNAGNNGGGSGTSTPIITNPNPPCDPRVGPCPELFEENSPCEKIKNGTSSAAYKQKFKALTNNYNLSHETGFVLKNVNGVDQYVDCVPDGNNMVSPPSGSKNGTHVHQNLPKINPDGIAYDGRVKIFSVDDLANLIRPLQFNNTDPKDAFLIMMSDEAIYSITILEPIASNGALAQKLREFKKFYNRKAQDIIVGLYSVATRKKLLEKMFLKGIKKMGLEDKIGFFEGIIENETATDINDYKINWTRKNLKSNFLGTSVETAPCN